MHTGVTEVVAGFESACVQCQFSAIGIEEATTAGQLIIWENGKIQFLRITGSPPLVHRVVINR
jgi:hypothetical protein